MYLSLYLSARHLFSRVGETFADVAHPLLMAGKSTMPVFFDGKYTCQPLRPAKKTRPPEHSAVKNMPAFHFLKIRFVRALRDCPTTLGRSVWTIISCWTNRFAFETRVKNCFDDGSRCGMGICTFCKKCFRPEPDAWQLAGRSVLHGDNVIFCLCNVCESSLACQSR